MKQVSGVTGHLRHPTSGVELQVAMVRKRTYDFVFEIPTKFQSCDLVVNAENQLLVLDLTSFPDDGVVKRFRIRVPFKCTHRIYSDESMSNA